MAAEVGLYCINHDGARAKEDQLKGESIEEQGY